MRRSNQMKIRVRIAPATECDVKRASAESQRGRAERPGVAAASLEGGATA
jgi:hypothetical protein